MRRIVETIINVGLRLAMAFAALMLGGIIGAVIDVVVFNIVHNEYEWIIPMCAGAGASMGFFHEEIVPLKWAALLRAEHS